MFKIYLFVNVGAIVAGWKWSLLVTNDDKNQWYIKKDRSDLQIIFERWSKKKQHQDKDHED